MVHAEDTKSKQQVRILLVQDLKGFENSLGSSWQNAGLGFEAGQALTRKFRRS